MTIANTDMAAAWDGDEGADWSREWKRFDRSLADYHARLMAMAAVSVDEHVLDVGCGNGQTTRDAARAASNGSALGVDLSSQMLARAREQAEAEGVTNVRFEQADAQVHDFTPGTANIVLSRFGSMFFADPTAAFANIGRALVPGGRLAILVWQPPEQQDWLGEVRRALAVGRTLPMPPVDAPGPFALADATTRSILEAAGYRRVEDEVVDGSFRLGDDADDAYGFASRMGITRGLLGDVSDDDRAVALERLRSTIDEHAGPDGVTFGSIARIVTATRG